MTNTGPITQAEMIEMFGESCPIEAVNLLWNSAGDKTVGELRKELREIAAKQDKRTPDLPRIPAFYTYDDAFGERCYYFAPQNRAEPPYVRQREVRAIIDLASDGSLAGVELIDDMPPPHVAVPQL